MIEKIKIAGANEVIQHGETWFEADRFLREELLPTRMQERDRSLHNAMKQWEKGGVGERDEGEEKGGAGERDEREERGGGEEGEGGGEEEGEGGGEDEGEGGVRVERAIYVPPFDHPDIWKGAATMILEIEEDLGDQADLMICSVGGGGLFCGIMEGLRNSPKTKVIAVETHGADSLAQSIEAGYLVTLPGITSIATSLGATRVAPQALKYALDREKVKSVLVTDEQACRACVSFADGERMLVEPACGASLAVCYEEELLKGLGMEHGLGPGWRFGRESKVVVVVCGGVGVSVDSISEWRTAAAGAGALK